jgi:hypothetical protein
MNTSLALLLLFTASAGASEIDRHFADPPPESRLASYFWSFGPAWTRPEIDRHLELLSRAGIGRILIYPLYPYETDDPARGIRNLPYRSPEFLEMLGYLAGQARAKGLDADLVMGTGWPYGGPMIPESFSPKRIVMKPGRLNTMEIDPPGENERIIAVQLVPRQGEAIDVTGRLRGQRVDFARPAGEWTLMTFLESPTTSRHRVIYAAAGAGGNVIDHLNPDAVALYLKEVGEDLAAAVKGKVRALYCPSMEVDGTSWTPRFLPEFATRRGYDLRPHLSALFRDEGEQSLHIRRDFWHTVQELAADRYLKTVGDWIRERGFRFQAESYGTPPVRLNSFGAVDYPMGEDCDWKEFNRTRWASSAAHFYQQPVVSVEAFTWLNPVRYAETLQELKIATDLHLVAGANRMVMHGYAYSPQSAPRPGWGYFAGVMATEHAPWWPWMPHLAKYIQRTGYVLSQGRPVADVALYLPEDDVFADTPPGYLNFIHVKYRLDRAKRIPGDNFGLEPALTHESDVVKTILTSGYALDGIDHSILSEVSKVSAGRLNAGHASFSVVVLPGLRGMPLADMEKLAEFSRAGGTVIATLRLPEIAYGYKDRERNAARFLELRKQIFGPGGRGVLVADEKEALRRALRDVPADLALSQPDDEIGFVHRRAGEQDFYFLANLSAREKHLKASFRVAQRPARFWDPMNGKIRPAVYRYEAGRVTVDLALDAWGSTIVEFGGAAEPATPAPPVSPRNVPVAGPWKVRWEGRPDPVEMTALRSWTEYPALRFFSGRATYETTVGITDATGRWLLDLGSVRETAEVWVNGRRAGVAWMTPYRVDVTGLLRKGANQLRVEVANTLLNYVLSQPAKDYTPVEARYPEIGNRIPRPKEKTLAREPLPSGLLGPVVLR